MANPTRQVDHEEPSQPDDETSLHAQRLFWLLPRFTRWAQARALQTRLGGDLSLQQLTVLYLIRTEGATLSAMARRLMVAPTVLTGIVDRLEKRGFVRRENDPLDRRKLRLCLTDDGRRVSIAVEQALVAEVASEMAVLTREDLAELDHGLALLERVFRGLEAATPADS
ncbi:MAG TPA: MarR family transcriptional regulator [Thermomicrobiales bacterium]|jgi:DNA-binding MarR family transcriptional regulator